jgi:hypothetical protein
MYQDYHYAPGEARQKGDRCGPPLPLLPNKPFLSAIMQYLPDFTFELFLRIDKESENVQNVEVIIMNRPTLGTANFLRLSRLVLSRVLVISSEMLFLRNFSIPFT